MAAPAGTGCTLAPKYTRPEAPGPGRLADRCGLPGDAGCARPRPTAAEMPWQEFFTDETPAKGHRDGPEQQPRSAAGRLECGTGPGHVRHSAGRTVAGGRCDRQRESSSGFRPIFRPPGSALTAERYDVNLGVSSWEIDFFGRIRSLKDRALEEYLATEQARRSAQILLVSAVANAYLALAADRENLKLAEITLETQKAPTI